MTAVPLIDSASASSVPSMSASPLTSNDPASNSPVSVMLRKLAASLLLSTTTAFDAATVPAVTPSIASSSASLITAPEPSVRSPDSVTLRKPVMSLLLSTRTPLLADTVPAVTPENKLSISKSYLELFAFVVRG